MQPTENVFYNKVLRQQMRFGGKCILHARRRSKNEWERKKRKKVSLRIFEVDEDDDIINLMADKFMTTDDATA